MTNNIENNVLKALSEQIRLRIAVLLTGKELCVCEFTELLKMPQPTISRHLSRLKEAAVVIDKRHGKWVYYQLNQSLLEEMAGLKDLLLSLKEKEPYKSDLNFLNSGLNIKKC